MTEFVSDVKTIPYNDADVYRVLSDPRNLELVKERIPEDKIRDFTFDEESISFLVDPIGKVRFLVVEREPNKLVKLKSEKLPFDVFLWIQLVSKAEKDTRLRMTLQADLNPFIKGMVEKPMKEAVDKISDVLAQLRYDQL
ncbi:MAG: SRPBCC family protein [Proteiniphilum sp.]|nr:SRPBCC family protein [Proteiniphilum sp.]